METIYECHGCGSIGWNGRIAHLPECRCDNLTAFRVFREEEVHPLWEAARKAAALPADENSRVSAWSLMPLDEAVDDFPAPPDWTGDESSTG